MDINISVIVPTCNRKNKLRKCLDSLSSQSYPREGLEIIVVDDSKNNNGASEVINEFNSYFPHLRYIAEGHKGPAGARNLGIGNSKGKIVAFVDDDCVVDKDWAQLMVKSHQRNPDIAAIGGETLITKNKPSVLVGQFLSSCSIETYINGGKEIVFFPTCNVSFKKEILNKCKFSEIFPLPGGEDLEFFWRLFKMGFRFLWNKDIKVFHDRDDAIHSFIRQAYIYGRGNLLTQYLHNDHPLLKELKAGRLSFWSATLVNFIKIPRFSFLLGKRLARENPIMFFPKKIMIYIYFIIHKIFYIFGNLIEFLRINSKKIDRPKEMFDAPRLLIFDITHSCNLSCRICDIWKTAKLEQDISVDHVKKILFQAKKMKIKEIALSGGEPLLRKDIFDILDYAHSIEIKNLGILTNGILISTCLDKLGPYIIDNTISLVISLDSLDPKIHNSIRNSDNAWQKTIECLNSLSSLKKEYPQINFSLISIILNQNLEELLTLARFIKSSGADSLQFQALLPNNLKMAKRAKSEFWIPEERFNLLDRVVDELIEFKKTYPDFVKNSTHNLALVKKYYRGALKPNDVQCRSAHKTILISNKGEYSTCFSCYGDLTKQELRDVFLSKKRAEAYEKVKKCHWPCLLPCFCDL